MSDKKKKSGYISNFLKRADKAIDEAIDQGIKRADEILDDAVEFGKVARVEAQKQSEKIHKQARKEGKKLKKEGKKKILSGISSAKKISYSKENSLRTLEKLGKLRKARIITEKEFQEKKKEVLRRI